MDKVVAYVWDGAVMRKNNEQHVTVRTLTAYAMTTHENGYKFKRGFATPIIFIFNLRRKVPYFYHTFWVKKFTPVAELNVIPDATWW